MLAGGDGEAPAEDGRRRARGAERGGGLDCSTLAACAEAHVRALVDPYGSRPRAAAAAIGAARRGPGA